MLNVLEEYEKASVTLPTWAFKAMTSILFEGKHLPGWKEPHSNQLLMQISIEERGGSSFFFLIVSLWYVFAHRPYPFVAGTA